MSERRNLVILHLLEGRPRTTLRFRTLGDVKVIFLHLDPGFDAERNDTAAAGQFAVAGF